MLSKYPHLLLYPIHPTSLADYRKALYPSGAKDDPVDADLILEMVEQHGHRLRALRPDTEETRSLQWLTENRRTLVADRTRYLQRLRAQLQLYFPQVLQWFGDLSAPVVLDFLQQWPTLAELKKARPATLKRFFHQHNCRQAAKIEERLVGIGQAVTATQDRAVLTAAGAEVAVLVPLLRQLHKGIVAHDRLIQQITESHPEHVVFSSFPGAGDVLEPRLIAAIGTQRDRYRSAHDIQCSTGIAPIVVRSGRQCQVRWRWSCPKFLRQTFHEHALHSIGYCAWAREYYQAQRDQGKGHHAAVRALAYKWIRIIYRCWQDHTPYDEARYLRNLAARNSTRPAPANPKKPVFNWASCAGFNKLIGLEY
jgi:transposase